MNIIDKIDFLLDERRGLGSMPWWSREKRKAMKEKKAKEKPMTMADAQVKAQKMAYDNMKKSGAWDSRKKKADESLITEAEGQYGVRWQEFDRNDRIKTKEKFFKTERARETFCNKLENKDNFKEFVAWSEDERFK